MIVNNILQNNSQAGVGVAETSFAFIGFVTSTDTVASPNLITDNRAQGIAVFRGSYARIVGNEISQNGANGVNVRESSSAQISDNVISANGMNGILVAQESGVRLRDTLTVGSGASMVRAELTRISRTAYPV